MGEMLTRGELAARMNVSRQRVEELIGEGRLVEVDGRIDLEAAQQLWASFDPSYMLRKEAAARPTPDTERISLIYKSSKAKEARVKAERAELELKIKQGLYVPIERVRQTALLAGKSFAQKCSNFPRRVAPLLIGVRDVRDIEKTLEEEVAKLLQEIRDDLAAVG